MKIVKCHIHNFGKLNDLDIVFDANPYVFYKDNGEGKTTLLNFILAMIYGLDTSKARNKEENLRDIYYPYNGGLFGGSLEIEKEGKTYRIERTFDKKSETKDEKKIYINNKEVGIDFAKEVVSLDEASFIKTLYYRDNDFDLSTPDSLTNNIIKLDSASSMAENYNKAVETLTKIEKNYSKNSDGGIIKGLEKNIKNAEAQKLSINYSSEEHLSLKNRSEELEEELKNLDKERDTIASFEIIKTKGELKEKAQNKLNEYEKENKEILNKYNNEIITVNDISDLRSINSSYDKCNREIVLSVLNAEEESNYLDLDYLFKKYPIDDEGLEEIKNKQNRLIQLEEKSNNLTNELTNEEKDIIELFEDKELKEDDINKIDEYLDQYQEAFNHVTNTSMVQSDNKKDNKLLYFLIALSLLLIAGGIALLLFLLIVGIITLSLGVILAIITIYLLAKNNKGTNNNDLIKETNRMKEYEDKLRGYTVKYAIYSPSIINDVNLLKTKYNTYLSIKERMSSVTNDKKEIEEEKDKIQKEFYLIKTNYMLDDDIYNSLNLKYHKYLDLKNKTEALRNKITDLKEKIEQLKKDFDVIKDKYKLTLSIDNKDYNLIIDSYKEDLNKYNANLKEIEYWKEELNRYQEDAIEIDTSKFRNKEEIEQDIASKKEELFNVTSRIKELENNKIEIDQLERNIVLYNEKLIEAKNKSKIYKATINALNETNNLIISKYIIPIKNDFVKYASKIEELIGQSVHLTSNFELEFKQGDSLRSYNHLSLGEKTIAGMVLRLSFISQLFKADKPFLLLDDPFTDLDEKHLAKAIKFIKDISKEMQVIYITCHPSRIIK